MSTFDISMIPIKKPADMNFILGQSHFIKTVEDIYETIMNSLPNAQFGIAFCEASGACKIRSDGTNKELISLAEKNALNIGAGHSFIIFLKDAFPLNILNSIKSIPEVCHIYCATANPTQILIAEAKNDAEQGRGIIGVIDGYIPKGIENEKDITWRKDFLRKINYKR